LILFAVSKWNKNLLSYIATKIKPITFAVMVAKEYLQESLINIRDKIQQHQLQIG